jgi:hypothetical protein
MHEELERLGFPGWTRALGTSVRSLRHFSVLWSLACRGVLARFAGRIGRRGVALIGVARFALSPVAV